MSERKTCKNCGQIREGHMAFARCIGGNTQWEPITKPAVPAQPAPTPDNPCIYCRWRGDSECDYSDSCSNNPPIPPTSAPTPEQLADICPSCGETDKTKRMPCANAWHDGYVSQLEAERNKLGREVLTASAEIASLKCQLAERKMCPECDRWMSQLSNGPTEYKYVCEFCELLKENDQLEAEIAELKRQLAEAERKGLKRAANHLMALSMWPAYEAIRALKGE